MKKILSFSTAALLKYCLPFILALTLTNNITLADEGSLIVDPRWKGFEYSYCGVHGTNYVKCYELQKDYTVIIPFFYGGPSVPNSVKWYVENKLALDDDGEVIKDWDFISLKEGGVLTIKKGYRWDGPTAPCKPDCRDEQYHVRSSLVHDAMYDLMRMGYIAPDTNHFPVIVDIAIDKITPGNRGDINRHIADSILYDLSLTDGAPLFDTDFFDYWIRDWGAPRTHMDKFLTNWKYHVFDLVAYDLTTKENGGKVRLMWQPSDAEGPGQDPEFEENNEPHYGYQIFRNQEKIADVDRYPTCVIDGIEEENCYIDDTADEGYTYIYQVRPDPQNTNKYDWSNLVTVVPMSGPGNALHLWEHSYQYVEVDTVSSDLVAKGDESFTDLAPAAVTLETWVYPKVQTSAISDIITFRNPRGPMQQLVYWDQQGGKFCYRVNGNMLFCTGHSPPDNWYHLALTLEAEGDTLMAALYLNGVIQAYYPTSNLPEYPLDLPSVYGLPSIYYDFSIGHGRYTDDQSFSGIIDETRVWKMERTQEEIRENMCVPLRGDHAGLIGLWHFDNPDYLYDVPGGGSWWPVYTGWAGVKYNPGEPIRLSKLVAPDASLHGNDGVLHGFYAYPGPFDPSGAMQPKIEAGEGNIQIYLDATGTASISADQIVAESMNTYCFEEVSVEPNRFSCEDTGELDVELRATDLYENVSTDSASVVVYDTDAPKIKSTVSATIKPSDVPISFNATATDNCELASFEITHFDCHKFTKKGKRINKTDECKIDLTNDAIKILESGGVGTHISWTLMATDESGNVTEENYETLVVNPGKRKNKGGGAIGLGGALLLLISLLTRPILSRERPY